MMELKRVGLLSPGDMGHTVGRVLVNNGMPVFTCLLGRSERTKALAGEAGIEALPTFEHLVRDTDILLSILVPAEAERAAKTVADALRATGEHLVYVDCNAIAPNTVIKVAQIITEAGSDFVDAGITGPPPKREGFTRFYASGASAKEFEKLREYGLDVRVIGNEVGQASGLKMTYAAMTKGTAALTIELLVSARRMGLYDVLIEELQSSQAQRYNAMSRELPIIPSKSRRWVGEMEEIAKTFDDLGLTPRIFQGAADLYRFVGKSVLADEKPETWDKNRSLKQMIDILAQT